MNAIRTLTAEPLNHLKQTNALVFDSVVSIRQVCPIPVIYYINTIESTVTFLEESLFMKNGKTVDKQQSSFE